jgi:hypothetical protein
MTEFTRRRALKSKTGISQMTASKLEVTDELGEQDL